MLKTNPQLGKRCVCLAVLHDNSGKSMITPIFLKFRQLAGLRVVHVHEGDRPVGIYKQPWDLF